MMIRIQRHISKASKSKRLPSFLLLNGKLPLIYDPAIFKETTKPKLLLLLQKQTFTCTISLSLSPAMDVPDAELDLNSFTNDHVILFASTDQSNSVLKASPAAAAAPAEPTTLQTPSRMKTLRRLAFSKPKSRFSEPATFPFSPKPTNTIFEGPDELQPLNPPPEPTSSFSSCSSDDDDDEWLDGDEDEWQGKHRRWRRNNKINKRAAIEWTLFLIITTCLVCSLTIEPFACRPVLGLMLWKWCVMVLVLFCGRLVSGWAVGLLVFLIERNFMLREKVLYFVYGLRRSFQNCAWLGLVLVAWVIMFPNVHGGNYQVVRRAFRILIAVLVAATFWLVKIVLVKVLASSFHVTTFFDRMKESVFHHYVLDALSGPPLEEEEREAPLWHGLQVKDVGISCMYMVHKSPNYL